MAKFDQKIGKRIKKIREDLDLSQKVFGKLLGISRVSVSQIENGQRKIKAEEITKISQIFNVKADSILDLDKGIEVVLTKEKSSLPNKKEIVRIDVPQKNLKKFKEVLLYILDKVGSKSNVGETVIYKLLYFIDFNFYEKNEEQLIGATYMKNKYGPTPLEFKKIIKEMEKKNEVEKIRSEYYTYPQTKYLPLRKPDLKELKANEIKDIDEVLEKLSNFNANEISDYSHKDIPWLTTEYGEVINYEKVFYRTLPYSVRSYEEEDI